MAGAVGGAILPVVLVGVAVVGTIVLGVETYKHLTAEKGAVTPTIAEQILEMARKKKEEQETIKIGPGDYDIINPDGSKVDQGGGENNNDDNNGEEKPAPVNPEPESSGSGSENVPDAVEESKTGKIWTGNDKYC